jgi:hypothetical protein
MMIRLNLNLLVVVVAAPDRATRRAAEPDPEARECAADVSLLPSLSPPAHQILNATSRNMIL